MKTLNISLTVQLDLQVSPQCYPTDWTLEQVCTFEQENFLSGELDLGDFSTITILEAKVEELSSDAPSTS